MPSITIQWDHAVKKALFTTTALPHLPARHLDWGELALAIAITEREGSAVAALSPREREEQGCKASS